MLSGVEKDDFVLSANERSIQSPKSGLQSPNHDLDRDGDYNMNSRSTADGRVNRSQRMAYNHPDANQMDLKYE